MESVPAVGPGVGVRMRLGCRNFGPPVHVIDEFRDRVSLDRRAGVELVAKLRAQLGADPLEKQRMGMEFAAILGLDADREINLAPEVARNAEARHDLIDRFAREMDGLAESGKGTSGVNDAGLGEKPHDLHVDAIASVGDDDDAGFRQGRSESGLLRLDAGDQGRQAPLEKLERLIIKGHAEDVLEPTLDRDAALNASIVGERDVRFGFNQSFW